MTFSRVDMTRLRPGMKHPLDKSTTIDIDDHRINCRLL